MVYIGIDLHRKRSQVAALGEQASCSSIGGYRRGRRNCSKSSPPQARRRSRWCSRQPSAGGGSPTFLPRLASRLTWLTR